MATQITVTVSDDELNFLRKLAKRNNTNVSQILLSSALGKARKMPMAFENLFNALVELSGKLRSLYVRTKDGVSADTLADMNNALERVVELTDMSWELIKNNKSVMKEQDENIMQVADKEVKQKTLFE